jgi:hypothetical protein
MFQIPINTKWVDTQDVQFSPDLLLCIPWNAEASISFVEFSIYYRLVWNVECKTTSLEAHPDIEVVRPDRYNEIRKITLTPLRDDRYRFLEYGMTSSTDAAEFCIKCFPNFVPW